MRTKRTNSVNTVYHSYMTFKTTHPQTEGGKERGRGREKEGREREGRKRERRD